MGRIVCSLAIVGLLTPAASPQDVTIIKGNTPAWFRSDGPKLEAPSFATTVVLDEKGRDGKSTGNGNGNGNGDGDGNGEREHISDNSFLIEEAYNQEPGVVQHIFNWVGLWSWYQGRTRESTFAYTMELPIHSQDHQLSFVIPHDYFFEQPDGGLPDEQGGLGDILLNYRYQLLMEDDVTPAVAPRFSLILPTGDRGRGLGTGELGYQFNLPISKQLDPLAFHFNAGYTYIPNTSVTLPNGLSSPGTDLHGVNLGVSAIWLVNYDFNLLVELVAFFDEELDDQGSRDHTTQVIINPGLRYAVYTNEEPLIQWVFGIGVPIGLSEDAPDIGVFGYMSVEHAFKKTNGN